MNKVLQSLVSQKMIHLVLPSNLVSHGRRGSVKRKLPVNGRGLLKIFAFFCLGLYASYPSFSQVSFENAFSNVTFEFPVEIQNTGTSGDDRLFVVGQGGIIYVLDNEVTTGTTKTFLDIRSDVLFNVGQELGLLGLAFHPNYQTNGYCYVYYTKDQEGNKEIVVERFTVDPNDADKANLSSRQKLFSVVKNQSNSNHNGGKISFGPDGYLYVSIGDGGGGGDPQRNAQNVNTYFGSILRLDVDLDGNNPVDSNGLLPDGLYEIPADNPLVNQDGLDEIYAWGIRNTWKMSFDPPTGRLWGGDVGQNAFEEINLIKPGNYGWNRFEGESVFNANIPDPGNTIPPVFFYDRSNGDRSITGGYVYRGSQVTSTNPSILGQYIFADYVSGRVWALDYNPTTQEATRELLFKASDGSSINISSFGLDINGEMYFAGYGSSGSIYKLKDGITPDNAVVVEGIGRWSDALGDIEGEVNAIVTTDDQTVYVGGDFTRIASEEEASNVAKWTPTEGWQGLAGGTNGVVNALALGADGALYAGGSFTTAGDVSARNVAKYAEQDGWEPLEDGVSGAVLAMITIGNTLYVGGAFVTASGTEANNVAKWDNGWSSLQDASTQQVGTNNEIRSMALDEEENLYVGGNFGSAGGKSASRIAQWDGNVWSNLGEGTSGFVQSILITDDYLYAGGNFTIAGNQTVNRIARWDRTSLSWQALNNGLSNSVNTIGTDGSFIYAGGQFSNALNTGSEDNIIVNSVVRWSEDTGWEALGEGTEVGVDNVVNALRFAGATLYAGGRFASAGQTLARNLATWSNGQVPSSARLEAATINFNQSSTTAWQRVNLTKTFTNPIVVVGPPSYNGGHPTTVRVRNVNSNSFEVQMDEWDYLDGPHTTEQLSYLVMEAGRHTLGGLRVEAGALTVEEDFKTQTFASSFSNTPVVLTQCASYNEPSAVTTRMRNVSAESFDIRLQEEEAADGVHASETLHYIALETGIGSDTRWDIEAALVGNSFTHEWKKVDFKDSYSNPLFFATMQSFAGNNTAALRYRSLEATSAELKVEEERSKDDEVNHIPEAVAYLVLSQTSMPQSAPGVFQTFTGSETLPSNVQLYPNPVRAGDEVMVKAPTSGLGQFIVHNEHGQIVFAGEQANEQRLNTQGWQPGLYLIRWQSSQGVQVRKLVITE